jgi:hypothetical protein
MPVNCGKHVTCVIGIKDIHYISIMRKIMNILAAYLKDQD